MAKNKKIFRLIIALLIVFFYSQKIVFSKYLALEKIPTPEILDEFDFVWVGKSFLQTGIPTGWSDFSLYRSPTNYPPLEALQNFSMQKDGQPITFKNRKAAALPRVSIETVDYGLGDRQLNFVAPYLDHPPLAALVYALGSKAETLSQVNPQQFRQRAATISLISATLIFLLAFQIAGPFLALLSFFIYQTVPSFVFLSRLGLAENIIVPLSLVSINLLYLYLRRSKPIFLILSGIFAGLSALTKLPGLFTLISGAICLLCSSPSINKKKPALTFFLVPALAIFSLYPLYGLLTAPSTFLEVIFSQSNRFFNGPVGLIKEILTPSFKNWFIDPWWLGSWLLSLAFLAKNLKNTRYRSLAIYFLCLLFTTIFMASASYPWYFITAIPFLSIFTAQFIKDIIFRPRTSSLLLFFLFFFSGSFHWGYHVITQSNQKSSILYKLFLLFFVFTAAYFYPQRKSPKLLFLWQLAILLILHRLLLWNFRSITYFVANWPLSS